MTADTSFSSVPLPVLLNIRQEAFAQFKQVMEQQPASHADVLSVLVEFALGAFEQVPASLRKGNLAAVLEQRLKLQDQLSKRLEIALSETERTTLFAEALVIECRNLLGRVQGRIQQTEANP